MSSSDPFDAPEQLAGLDIPRDRWGRPLIVPPGGGEPVPYTRCTTYVGCLEDTNALTRWKQRMTAIGLASRPDLILSVNAHRDDKEEVGRIVDAAMDAAKAGAAASIGTSLHKLTEYIDNGEALPPVPPEYEADLDAYRAATAHLEVIGIERFTVLDDLLIGGTHDRTVRYQGRDYIGDLKTGSIDLGALKIAMQLAVYSRSVLYDPATGERTPLDVDQDRAIVIHLPAGSGHCTLHWVDINAGWQAVQVATQVREWRARSGLFTPFPPPAVNIDELIAAAAIVEDLTGIWKTHRAAWTDEHTALAAAKKNLLLGGLG